jgi:hypothetical protein
MNLYPCGRAGDMNLYPCGRVGDMNLYPCGRAGDMNLYPCGRVSKQINYCQSGYGEKDLYKQIVFSIFLL